MHSKCHSSNTPLPTALASAACARRSPAASAHVSHDPGQTDRQSDYYI